MDKVSKKIEKQKNIVRMKSCMKNHKLTSEATIIDLTILEYIKSGKRIDKNHPNFDGCDMKYLTDRQATIKSYMTKLDKLKEYPFVKQRTAEWFDMRNNMITASVLDEALKDNNVKYAKKKAGVIKDTTAYNAIPALKWGTMFEPMAIRCYSQSRNNIGVHEFGLITNENIKNFGASPDGINDMGIMIEIKCPYSRQIIDEKIPEKYYLQIQGQLAVCELNECDYIECNFIGFETIEIYKDYIMNVHNNPSVNHGIIAEFKNIETDEYEYLYSKELTNAQEAIQDIDAQVMRQTDHRLKFIKLTPWFLKEMNIQRVYFDEDEWKNNIQGKISTFWNTIEECKKLPPEVEEAPVKPKYVFIDDE